MYVAELQSTRRRRLTPETCLISHLTHSSCASIGTPRKINFPGPLGTSPEVALDISDASILASATAPAGSDVAAHTGFYPKTLRLPTPVDWTVTTCGLPRAVTFERFS